VIDLFERLVCGDVASAFKEFREQYDTGADPVVVLSDLAEFVNFVTRVKIVPATADNVAFSETERLRARDFAAKRCRYACFRVCGKCCSRESRRCKPPPARRPPRKWCWSASPMSPTCRRRTKRSG
jgi:hypothetical protein